MLPLPGHSTLPATFVVTAIRPTFPSLYGSAMSEALNDTALDQLFRTARTYNAFGGEVSDDTLRQLYELLKFGPTQANTTPARFVFVKSAEAKAKLGPALDEGNYKKTMGAPVVSRSMAAVPEPGDVPVPAEPRPVRAKLVD